MNYQKAGLVPNGKNCTIRRLMIVTVTVLAICLPLGMLRADTRWTPSILLIGIHDDNILYSRTEATDDTIYLVEPTLQLDYQEEVTRINANGSVFFRRYQDNDDLNDEIYNLNFNSDSNFTERFRLRGSYEFIKDTTLDSELQEIGRIFFREDRMSHNVRLSPRYSLNERMSIGLGGRYRDVAYDSDTKVDYSVWGVNVPLRWKLATEVDSVYISPGYSYRDSDTSSSTTYDLRVGWDHETTERLNLNFSVGARYTEHERLGSGNTDETWSGLGHLQLNYDFETGAVKVDFEHDLRSTADGTQANVTKLISLVRWNFTERIGLELEGRYYYAKDEGENNEFTSQYYFWGSKLFYNLTENHVVFIAYDFSKDHLDDVPNDPSAERNRIWAGVNLSFPMY